MPEECPECGFASLHLRCLHQFKKVEKQRDELLAEVDRLRDIIDGGECPARRGSGLENRRG